jgi:hypothetical protein
VGKVCPIGYISINDDMNYFIVKLGLGDIREWEKLAHPKCYVFLGLPFGHVVFIILLFSITHAVGFLSGIFSPNRDDF